MCRELAALVARSPFGQGAAWLVEVVRSAAAICDRASPVPGLTGPELAAGLRIAEQLRGDWRLVELFETDGNSPRQ